MVLLCQLFTKPTLTNIFPSETSILTINQFHLAQAFSNTSYLQQMPKYEIQSQTLFSSDLILLGPRKAGTTSFAFAFDKFNDIEYFGKESRYWRYVTYIPM